MGDRAVVIFCRKGSTPAVGDKNQQHSGFSPSVYLHWDGHRVADLLKLAAPRMRRGDESYSCARFIGVCHENIGGNLSLGVHNGPGTISDVGGGSPGDAGTFLVDVTTWRVRCFDGYGFATTLPEVKDADGNVEYDLGLYVVVPA